VFSGTLNPTQSINDRHFEEVRGGVEPWWMAHWKARAVLVKRN